MPPTKRPTRATLQVPLERFRPIFTIKAHNRPHRPRSCTLRRNAPALVVLANPRLNIPRQAHLESARAAYRLKHIDVSLHVRLLVRLPRRLRGKCRVQLLDSDVQEPGPCTDVCTRAASHLTVPHHSHVDARR